jgi:PhzF family phenazine biosynthesis protein
MPLPLFIVDAFATAPHRGNPAAVCLLDRPRDDAWMQTVAAEMNLSETAFLLREADAWRLRWMTPTVEVDLCGHATLASAHVLWETGTLRPDEPARFLTRSGPLTCERGAGGLIEMDFPAEPAVDDPHSPADLLQALGVADGAAVVAGRKRNRMDYLVELASAEAVRALKPDFARLGTMPVRGVIVTARADDPRFDFVSRFFAPAAGVNEDPVTGSAHCCLAPYWAAKLAKDELTGHQCGRRGGVVHVRASGPRVALAGHARTTVRGEWVGG